MQSSKLFLPYCDLRCNILSGSNRVRSVVCWGTDLGCDYLHSKNLCLVRINVFSFTNSRA